MHFRILLPSLLHRQYRYYHCDCTAMFYVDIEDIIALDSKTTLEKHLEALNPLSSSLYSSLSFQNLGTKFTLLTSLHYSIVLNG